jgi:hypothetical protein
VLELLRGEVGKLERDRGERDEAVRVLRADLDEPLVVETHHFRRGLAIGAVPEGIDAERLHVDPLRVHRPEPTGQVLPLHHDPAGVMLVGILPEQLRRRGDETVRVHVDGPHPLALYLHFATPGRGLRRAPVGRRFKSKPRLWRGHC